jgi:hypothetical protein
LQRLHFDSATDTPNICRKTGRDERNHAARVVPLTIKSLTRSTFEALL